MCFVVGGVFLLLLFVCDVVLCVVVLFDVCCDDVVYGCGFGVKKLLIVFCFLGGILGGVCMMCVEMVCVEMCGCV